MRTLPLLAALVACVACDFDAPDPPRGPPPFRLTALHAEPDPLEGGRIADALGREVILRGVNVNAHVEYWQRDAALFTTYPFTPRDADLVAGMGWSVVRLLLSWSRVEPAPGTYDEAYLDEIEASVRLLASRGIYSIVDLHQDAWGATLAARPGETCPAGSTPAFGWDGAPGWATLVPDATRRCVPPGQERELGTAVLAAFRRFWSDAPGPDGVGIRTRYVRMLGHVALRFAPLDAVAGYDPMNEPNAFFAQEQDLVAMYEDALAEIRAAETDVGAPHRVVFLEPSILWNLGPHPLPPFAHDDQIAYAPHLYVEPDQFEAFYQAASDDAALLGGAPVLIGEWGGDPRRAEDPADTYFAEHQAFQDAFRFGATLWTWREACGDPHKAGDWRDGVIPYVWGLFEVDCATNTAGGLRVLATELRRPAVRAAPGRLTRLSSDAATGVLDAAGAGAEPKAQLVAFLPWRGRRPNLEAQGVFGLHRRPGPGGGTWLLGFARGGDWSLRVEP